jgi:hypothetical protein
MVDREFAVPGRGTAFGSIADTPDGVLADPIANGAEADYISPIGWPARLDSKYKHEW